MTADGIVALLGPDGRQGVDEDREVLDRFGTREDVWRVLAGLFLLQELDGEDAACWQGVKGELEADHQPSINIML